MPTRGRLDRTDGGSPTAASLVESGRQALYAVVVLLAALGVQLVRRGGGEALVQPVAAGDAPACAGTPAKEGNDE